MLRTFHATTSFDQRRSAQPTTSSITPRLIWEALRGGLTASRQYAHLTSRGIAHDPAIREALGTGPAPHR
jgi:hypothetical protein